MRVKKKAARVARDIAKNGEREEEGRLPAEIPKWLRARAHTHTTGSRREIGRRERGGGELRAARGKRSNARAAAAATTTAAKNLLTKSPAKRIA